MLSIVASPDASYRNPPAGFGLNGREVLESLREGERHLMRAIHRIDRLCRTGNSAYALYQNPSFIATILRARISKQVARRECTAILAQRRAVAIPRMTDD